MGKYEVGERVYIEAMSGMCTGGEDTVTAIKTKYDEDTGEPYTVVFCGDHGFREDNGAPINQPWMYGLRKL